MVGAHFWKCGHFFRSVVIVGRTEQGAGELGPLGAGFFANSNLFINRQEFTYGTI